MEFYTNKILLPKNIIEDIFSNFKPETKMLVFGLGHDSKMWYGGNKNTYFIENIKEYISLNKDIPDDNIIEHQYNNINVKKSFTLSDADIEKYIVPDKLKDLAPFDIILIDGPEGWRDDKPGRLVPYYWTTQLSQPGTYIYCDDSSRALEAHCITKFFGDKEKQVFKYKAWNGGNCTKIFY